jgi:hypothetical protein
MDLCERFSFLDSTFLIMREGPGVLESFSGLPASKTPNPALKSVFDSIDWDPALRNANRYFDRMAAALRIKDRPAREKECEALEIEIKELKGKILVKTPLERIGGLFFPLGFTPSARGKFIGDVLISLLVPAQRKVQAAADRVEQVERNLHLAFALAAFQRDNGKYPDKLDALAPKYLKAIPLDLFSGKPLVYQPKDGGYLLYSVGPNGKDEGGLTVVDDPPGDDLVVRMPLPAWLRQP